MEGFGIEKLALILVIVLVLFGARRIPEIGSSIGKGIREFKRGMSDLGSEAEPPAAQRDRVSTPASPTEARADAPAEPKRLRSG